jgi:acetoin utilization deacetylase AcuC-like enzyme
MLQVAFDPIYVHPLPEGHRFPMLKYELIPQQLMYEGVVSATNFMTPTVCPDDVVLLTHTETYLQKLKSQQLTPREQRVIGFPQSPELTHRELVITQGTIDCCYAAREHGVAMNVAGGTHHAFADRGEGFCLLNDFAVAANYLLNKKLATRILIVDLDVHQGNGTAAIFKHDERVFTFSMHGAHNYPFIKEQSDLDIALSDGTGDDEYLSLLSDALHKLTTIASFDFAFYQSGVDILSSDKFGKLKITQAGCEKRDRIVFETMHSQRIPVVVSMGGGYSSDIRAIVDAHCNTFKAAKDIFGL